MTTNEKKFLSAIILIAIIGIILLFLSGCISARKAEKVLEKKKLFPAICAIKFPIKDSIVYKDSIKIDTIYEKKIELPSTIIHDTSIINKFKIKEIVKTVFEIKEVFRENTAKVKESEINLLDCYTEKNQSIGKYNEVKIELSKWKLKAIKRWWALAVTGVAAILFFGLFFYKKIKHQ